ncbi:CBS domain-containing protein [Pleurocapsales cyanobacterium LEGE 10410]|nr:CBS domain-containing protein [Pleurocapsales cyanobacterium LEGE 10410]
MPTVEALMQPSPYSVKPDASVAEMVKLMREHQIRHIPIQIGDRVIGIVSERDLGWMKSPAIVLPDANEIPVRHVMTANPYAVEVDTPLTTVVSVMSERKIGAAIVLKEGKLAGIVTVIDICHALVEFLNSEFSDR